MNTISRHTATYVDMDVRLVPQGAGVVGLLTFLLCRLEPSILFTNQKYQEDQTYPPPPPPQKKNVILSTTSKNNTCRIPVGWFSGSGVRIKSFFSPPSYGLILVLLYLDPSYLVVWCVVTDLL